MQQIVIIHGGRSFESYEKYIFYLKNSEVNIEKFKPKKDWKDALEKQLGDDFEIIAPRMPNKTNARYEEWRIWFERIFPFLNEGVVLIGCSLGGMFLAKYLSENLFPLKIKGVILMAAPFDVANVEGSLADFRLPDSLEKFSRQAGKIYLAHSKDDSIVPFNQLDKYKGALSKAETLVFDDKQHFNQEYAPNEIIRVIKSFKD